MRPVVKLSMRWPVDDPSRLSFNKRTIVESLRLSGASLHPEKGTLWSRRDDGFLWRYMPDRRVVCELFRWRGRVVVAVPRSPQACEGPGRRLWRGILLASLRRSAHLVAWDTMTLRELEAMGIAPDHMTHVPYPVDHEFFAPTPLGDTILCPGDNSRVENVVAAVQATGIAQVVRCTREQHVVDYHQKRRTGVLAKQCETMEEVRSLYNACRAVIIPVVPDVHPAGLTTVVEAMSCARPVLVPRSKASAGNVVDGQNAFVLPDLDPGTWVAAIERLWAQSDLLDEVGRSGREWVLERHTCAAVGRRWADVWDKCGGLPEEHTNRTSRRLRQP